MPTAIRFGTTGPIPQVLHLVTVPFPTPSSPTTSIVRIRASAINPSDVKNVTGTFPETTVPRTPGRDFAGVIVEGEGKGKRVWGTGGTSGFDKDGTHAQSVSYPGDVSLLGGGGLSSALCPVHGGLGEGKKEKERSGHLADESRAEQVFRSPQPSSARDAGQPLFRGGGELRRCVPHGVADARACGD